MFVPDLVFVLEVLAVVTGDADECFPTVLTSSLGSSSEDSRLSFSQESRTSSAVPLA